MLDKITKKQDAKETNLQILIIDLHVVKRMRMTWHMKDYLNKAYFNSEKRT